MSKLTGGQHIGNVLTTPLGATIRGQYVGAFLEVATASHLDDGQHIPTATAAHTTRYDLQADMVALSCRTDGADHGGRCPLGGHHTDNGNHTRPTRRRVPGGGGHHGAPLLHSVLTAGGYGCRCHTELTARIMGAQSGRQRIRISFKADGDQAADIMAGGDQAAARPISPH